VALFLFYTPETFITALLLTAKACAVSGVSWLAIAITVSGLSWRAIAIAITAGISRAIFFRLAALFLFYTPETFITALLRTAKTCTVSGVSWLAIAITVSGVSWRAIAVAITAGLSRASFFRLAALFLFYTPETCITALLHTAEACAGSGVS
jgi:hypothetical protein